MLEGLSKKRVIGSLPSARKFPPGQPAHDRALEFPGRPSRSFFPAVEAVTKHPGHHSTSAQKMNLKTVRLFPRTSFCVDTADIRF
jgi:hypothetical protein